MRGPLPRVGNTSLDRAETIEASLLPAKLTTERYEKPAATSVWRPPCPDSHRLWYWAEHGAVARTRVPSARPYEHFLARYGFPCSGNSALRHLRDRTQLFGMAGARRSRRRRLSRWQGRPDHHHRAFAWR